ncbi:MAG: hypothetical protein GY730_09230 [bacterium]|nr:hypothetical protein [bacterium]
MNIFNLFKKAPKYLVYLLLFAIVLNVFFSNQILCFEPDGQINVEFATEQCQIDSNITKNLLELNANNQSDNFCIDMALQQKLVFNNQDEFQYNCILLNAKPVSMAIEDNVSPEIVSIIISDREAIPKQFFKQINSTILII